MRLKRLNFACVIVGLFVSFTAGGDVDSKKLHGTWVASKGIGTIKGFTVTIGPENAFKMEAEGKESVAGKYVVDWTRTPAHLDFDAGEKGKFKTLIELKGDTLKFENVLPGMERPKNFSANVAAFKRGTAVPKKELPVAPVTVEIETDWKPETCFKIKNVDNVHPSPDGRRVAYTVLSVALGQDSKMGSTLVVMDADGANFRTVASGEHFRQVEWSRDGQWLAYLDGVRLMRIRPDGAGGEFITNSVYSFHWSPDGAMIAVTRMLSRLDPFREVDTYSKVVGANFHLS